jgi:GT2 family glycosyltransferase
LDVSVIIVNWNTCDILRDCLASLYASTSNLTFEVIVVDNASSDGSVDMIKSEFSQVKLIVNAENRGFAAANNKAIAVAKGRYVLLLNSDTIVLDNAPGKVVDFADLHQEAGITGCRVLNEDKTLQPTCFMFPSILNMILWITYLFKLFPRSRFFGRERMTWWSRDDVREVDVLTGCFMLVRREAIEQIGPMDERFFMYFEETDWCYRFRQAGWKVMFTPNAEIVHLGGASSKQVRTCMVNQWRKSMLLYYKKHKSLLAYISAWVLIALFLLTRVLYWRIKGTKAKFLVNG